jgi:hypothetical protein
VRAAPTVAAVAALAGGTAWAVKSAAILLTGDQPPVLFDVAPPAFAVALTAAGVGLQPVGRRRTAVIVLGALSTAAAAVALVSELVAATSGAALAVSSVALVVGLVLLDGSREPLRPGRAIGLATVPLLLAGGVLAEVHERLLELPLLVLSLGWLWWGVRLARATRAAPPPVFTPAG